MPTVVQKVSPKIRRRIRITYFCIHTICIFTGICILFTAYSSRKAERDTVKIFNLNVTTKLSILFYSVGGAIIISTLVGLVGMYLDNSYFWIVYSMLMVIVCLTAVAGAGSALDDQGRAIRDEMKRLISNYKAQNIKKEVNQLVDLFQKKYKCCGIDNYTNWQDVEFGRTSLRLPTSCCKPIDDSGNKADAYCGHLCLPDHVNLTKVIHTEGCYKKMSSKIRANIILLGIFGLFTFLLTGFTFILTCYLIISKKMDARASG